MVDAQDGQCPPTPCAKITLGVEQNPPVKLIRGEQNVGE